jgi:hypothetical protein
MAGEGVPSEFASIEPRMHGRVKGLARNSRGALNALAALLPDTAERVTGADTETVPLSELRVGDKAKSNL